MFQVGFLLVFVVNTDAGYTHRAPSIYNKSAPLRLSNLRSPAYNYNYGYTNQYSTYPGHNRHQYPTNTVSYISQQHAGASFLHQHQGGQHQQYHRHNQPAVYGTVSTITQPQQLYHINEPNNNNQPAVYDTVSTITQPQQSYNINQHSNKQPTVYETVSTITQPQQSYNYVNNYQLPSNNQPAVYGTVSAITQPQQSFNINNHLLPSENQQAVYQTSPAITPPQNLYINNHQPSHNQPAVAVFETVSAITQPQESYHNVNNYQISNNNQHALYQTVSATAQQQQSYNTVDNYVTTQYGTADSGYYNQNSGNAEPFYPVKTIEEHQDDQANGLHINEEYHTELETHVHQPPVPVVSKHIYFHVPPADVEEHPFSTAPAPSGPRKKVYNILFIKVPANQATNNVQLQQILAKQQNLVEDKTLIYVLVKKPDPQPIPHVPVTPINSQHEVFYVNYKGDGSEEAAQINQQLAQLNGGDIPGASDNVDSSQLLVQSDLVNDHH